MSQLDQLVKIGVQYGYSRTRRHPSVKRFLAGSKSSTDIIDVGKITLALEEACKFIKQIATEGKQVLYVGTKMEAREAVERAAGSINMPRVTERWVGGTLTNFTEIKKRVALMEELRADKQAGKLGDGYTKREKGLLAKELEDLTRLFGGIVGMKQMPGALFIIDSSHEKAALDEAHRLKIPVVALANSDCDVRGIDYPIVANDASRDSIEFFVSQITEAYKEGLKEKNDNSATDQTTQG